MLCDFGNGNELISRNSGLNPLSAGSGLPALMMADRKEGEMNETGKI